MCSCNGCWLFTGVISCYISIIAQVCFQLLKLLLLPAIEQRKEIYNQCTVGSVRSEDCRLFVSYIRLQHLDNEILKWGLLRSINAEAMHLTHSLISESAKGPIQLHTGKHICRPAQLSAAHMLRVQNVEEELTLCLIIHSFSNREFQCFPESFEI